DNIEEPIGIDELTGFTDISKRQIERLFKRYLGLSPAQYYKNIRLDYGRNLIVETDLSVNEISFACGFNSRTNFSKCYKQRFGESPSPFIGAARRR
ncbi:MAG: helix-turn-helix domain-containing protein, partial [Sulfitobacter sp.]